MCKERRSCRNNESFLEKFLKILRKRKPSPAHLQVGICLIRKRVANTTAPCGD
jgi:hypothetical protein